MAMNRDGDGRTSPASPVFPVASGASSFDGKRAVLQRLLVSASDGVRRAPVSFAQRRLWFLDQMKPRNALFNIASSLLLEEPLDVPALEAAVDGVVRRHEVLRASFCAVDGRPFQVFDAQLRFTLRVVDLRACHVDDLARVAQHIAASHARCPFDLGGGPLFRVTLLRLDGRQNGLLLAMHHIVSDGWSTGVFIDELLTLYAAFVHGEPSPLGRLPVQYVDYAIWQRRWLVGDVLEAQISYWREQLRGCATLDLPLDHARPEVLSFRGTIVPTRAPVGLGPALSALARSEGTTLFMGVLAAFQILLQRYTGQDDIAVGTPIAGRNQREFEGLIGSFVNTLVIRTQLDDRMGFRDVLRCARAACLDAYAHQDVPFEMLVERLRPMRDLARTPLFQVSLALQNAEATATGRRSRATAAILPERCRGRFANDTGTSKYDLSLHVLEVDGELEGTVEYSTDLFCEATITRMFEHMWRLAMSAVADPDAAVRELPLLSAGECEIQLETWNATTADYPRTGPVHALFEAQVLKRPDAIALVDGERAFTYRELAQRSDLLARRLRRLGVEPEVLVAVYLERSVDLVVALLAICRAGGGYVPLDPDEPRGRLAYMLKDARAWVVVTKTTLVERLPRIGQSVLCMDVEASVERFDEQPHHAATGQNLIYAMYTSGSTGTPKGVAIPHHAVTRLVCAGDYVSLGESDRVAQASHAAFDAFTFELWGALSHGACLVITPREVLLDADTCERFLEEQRITVLFVTTALFHLFARSGARPFARLKHLLFGGESAEPQLVRKALSASPAERLVHVYGPTEATTFSTWALVRGVDEGAVTVPIGRPLQNTQAYVLDARLQPVPIGVTGELFLSGDGLARGYLHCPLRTAEFFVPHPFASGTRLYRTGDRVRARADGALEFVGRVDRQVKIRGFRVELGEIEAVLTQHSALREAVVREHRHAHGERVLAAYVVPAGSEKPSMAELRRYLRERLPPHMVPADFVTLSRLPLTSSGKIDRDRLPVPEQRETGEEQVAPRNEEERGLAEIWSEVLGVRCVGIHDDFFDLGGHSLLATQAVSRIRERFATDLPLQSFFEGPTVAQLAERIAFQRWLQSACRSTTPAKDENREDMEL